MRTFLRCVKMFFSAYVHSKVRQSILPNTQWTLPVQSGRALPSSTIVRTGATANRVIDDV